MVKPEKEKQNGQKRKQKKRSPANVWAKNDPNCDLFDRRNARMDRPTAR